MLNNGFKAVILTFNKDVSRLAVDLLIDANADKLGPQKSNLLGIELRIEFSAMSKNLTGYCYLTKE